MKLLLIILFSFFSLFKVNSSENINDIKVLLELSKKSELEDKFNQDIEELSQETESLVKEIDKWQM